MIFARLPWTNPYLNLAAEEIFFRSFDQDVFLLWQNDNTIVVGKNQNTSAEIDADFVHERHINVVRRITGGGAVYHDLGNLNFSYIANTEWQSDFSPFIQPVVRALKALGLDSEISGRNDIIAGGKKISGNAQTHSNGRTLHHGTLLINSDLSVLSRALKPDSEKIESKGVASVAARVANVAELLGKRISANEIAARIREELSQVSEFEITPALKQRISDLSESKYQTWDWNYGTSPKYTYRNKKRFPAGTVEILLDVEKGVIRNAKIFGDFFFNRDISELEKALVGVRHDKVCELQGDFSEHALGINLLEVMK